MGGGHWQTLRRGEFRQLVQSRPAVSDHPCAGRQDGSHPLPMSLRFSGAAELGMGDRDQVVHEVDGPDIRLSGPRSITVRVESSMTDVQIEPVLPRATPRPKVPEYTRHQAPAKMLLRTFQQSEEAFEARGSRMRRKCLCWTTAWDRCPKWRR